MRSYAIALIQGWIMAIHDLWSFDNAPQSSTDISQGTSLTYPNPGTYYQYTNLPGVLYKNTGGTGTITADGFLNLISSASWNPALVVKAADVQDWSVATQYWIGFRTKTSQQSPSTTAVFRVANTLAQGSYNTILAESDLTAAAAATLNTEYYVEIFIDRVNLIYQVYINGKFYIQAALAAVSLPAAGAGFYFWGGLNSASAVANANRSFRDFYFLDVDSVDKTRLGPLRSSPAVLSNIAGAGWTLNSAADLPTALTTVLQNPPITTPSASAPANNQPVTANLSTSVSANAPIIAVQPQLTLIGDAAANLIDVSFSQASNTLDAGKIIVSPNTNLFNQKWGAQRKAPDGGLWTPAKINATSAILTPKTLNTVVLMHMESFVDDTGRTWTSNGNGVLTTGQVAMGSKSYNSGTTGNLSVASDTTMVLGSAMTVEFWLYRTAALGDTTILSSKTANTTTGQTSIGQQSDKGLAIYLTDGSGWNTLASAAAFTLNKWQHCAVVYANGVYTGYIGGVAQGTLTSALTFGLSGSTWTIGGNQYNTASQFPGYIDELRVSNIARYAANFTPPAAPFVID